MRLALSLIVLCIVGTASAASSGTWHTRGQALRGDLDGDRRTDTVVVEQRGSRCVFRLAGSLTARLQPSVCREKPSELESGPDPHVAALVPIDGHRGLEVVVQLGHGAYMEFGDIWTVRDGALRRFAGPEPHVSYGASAGTGGHVVDCASRGVVLVSDRKYPPGGRIFRRW